MEKSFTTKDPARLAPQPKQNKTFHRRDAEFAEFGVYLYQTDSYSASSAPPRWAFRKIAQAAQKIRQLMTFGFGNCSRQGAKAPSLKRKDDNLSNDFHCQTPNFATFASL